MDAVFLSRVSHVKLVVFHLGCFGCSEPSGLVLGNDGGQRLRARDVQVFVFDADRPKPSSQVTVGRGVADKLGVRVGDHQSVRHASM